MKAFGQKSYGTIPHLPGSRLGPKDYRVHDGIARIMTSKVRDRHDLIVVQEKLDGSNVAIANIDGVITPIIRSGHTAVTSPRYQHRMFANWVFERIDEFSFLNPGERLCGEWLAQAHGTRYANLQSPFVAFDIMIVPHERLTWGKFMDRVSGRDIATAKVLHLGGPVSIEQADALLGVYGHHGAIDPAEGCVWRLERKGEVDTLAKYVRQDKVDGRYLPEMSGAEEVWNWKPQ